MTYASGLSTLLFPRSVYETKAVIIAMIITAVVSISVTIFCFQTKVRVWGWGASLATPHPLYLYNLALQAWPCSRPATAQTTLHQGFPSETPIPFPTYLHLRNSSLQVPRMSWLLRSLLGGSTGVSWSGSWGSLAGRLVVTLI